MATMAVYGITFGLLHPLLSLILANRGVSPTLIGLNAAMPAIAMMLFSPLAPRIIARIGIRRFLFGCMGVEIALLAALPTFDSLAAWFVIRLGLGATLAGMFIGAESWMHSIVDESSRGRVMGIYTTLYAAGFACGPAIIPFTGIEGWAPFLVAMAVVAAAGLPLLFAPPVRIDLAGSRRFGAYTFFLVAPVMAAAWLLLSFKESAGTALLSVYGLRSGLAPDDAALVLTALAAGAMAFQYPFGWLADRFNRQRVLLAGGAGGVLGALLLPFAVEAGWLLWPFLFLWGGMFNGMLPVTLTLLGQHFRGAELVSANAALGMIWGLGSIFGPSTGGAAMDVWDPHGLPAMMVLSGTAFVILGLTLQVAPRRNRSRA
jgi:MFS family permease